MKTREDECCLTRIWAGPSPCGRWQSAWARAACPAAASCNCGPPPDWKNILQCGKIFCGEKKYFPNGKTYPNAYKPVKSEFVQLLLGQVEVALDGGLDGDTVLKVG